ncbi:MAG: hypothetical protein ACREGG_04800 [Candidatus Saccharimonadales bacterium]
MAEITQSKENPKKAPRQMSWWPYTLAGLVAIVLVVVGWLAYRHYNPAYVSYNLSGQQAGSGMNFDRPGHDSDVLYSKTGQVELADNSSSKINSLIFAAIDSTSKPPYTTAQLKSLATIFSSVQNSLYLQYSQPIGEFVSTRLPTGTSATYTPFATFADPNIKANAWQTSFTTSGSKSPTPQLKGKLIYAITDHGYYYFMFYTSAAKWVGSQTTWNHVLNSLRVE